MEKLKSATNKSSISSLRFQSKSDFDKFLKFIKKETKELKEIQTPKDSNLKKFLKVGAVGLGGLGIIGLLSAFGGRGGGDSEDDEVDRSIGDFAIGRRNIDDPRIQPTSPIGPRRPVIYPTRGTNANPKVKVTKSTRQRQTIKTPEKTKVKQAERSVTLNESRNRRSNIKKRKVRLKKAELSGNTLANKTTSSGVTNRPDKTSVRKFRDNIRKTIRNKKISNVGGGFDLSDPDFIKDMDEVTKELYKLENLKKKGIKPNQFFDGQDLEVERVILDAQMDPDLAKLDKIDKGLDKLLDEVEKVNDKPLPSSQFKKTRFNVRNFTAKRVKRITDTLSKNIFNDKGPFKNITRTFLRGNKNITKDSFLGLSYKGPKLSFLSTAVNHPVAKAGFFILDAYAAYQSGKKVFNLKDNLAYSLYDLYVSINNAINEDDPSKLKLYISESSNDNMRTKQILRNQKILQLKEQAESEGGGNNIIVVPTDEGGKQTNLIDNTPTKKGGDKISFVPYEPVNIGEDILLYNLNE